MYFSGVNPIKMLTKDLNMFFRFYPAALTRVVWLKVTGKKLRNPIFAGHVVHSQSKANERIKEAILSNKPFMFGRHGSNEIQMAFHGQMLDKGIIEKIDCKKLTASCEHSGFFPVEEEMFRKFNELIIEATEQCDIYGAFRAVAEDYYMSEYLKKDAVVTHTNTMDFWRYEEPFTYALKGKKVLVVHYLAEQIEEQYKKRDKLFENKKVLPEFELRTFKAVQTIAGQKDPRFANWFEALDYMCEEIQKIDFDIAILGCGAYGMPLSAKIKKMGKQSIYMGGVLQMLFGIRGRRWDAEPKAAALYNEHWVSPDAGSVPKGSNSVEGGCYW